MPPQYTPRRSRHPEKFPNAIREYRLRAGLSQRALGKILGHGRNAVSAWERGLSFPKEPKSLLRLAKTLGTLVESLYHHFYSPDPAGEGETDKPTAA